jgi:flagella basal body P-ring formation protein FlgA
MKEKTILVAIGLAVACYLMCRIVPEMQMRQQARESLRTRQMAQRLNIKENMVIAKKTISPHMVITDSMIEVKEVPLLGGKRHSLQGTYFVIGQTAAHEISAGKILEPTDFTYSRGKVSLPQ